MATWPTALQNSGERSASTEDPLLGFNFMLEIDGSSSSSVGISGNDVTFLIPDGNENDLIVVFADGEQLFLTNAQQLLIANAQRYLPEIEDSRAVMEGEGEFDFSFLGDTTDADFDANGVVDGTDFFGALQPSSNLPAQQSGGAGLMYVELSSFEPPDLNINLFPEPGTASDMDVII